MQDRHSQGDTDDGDSDGDNLGDSVRRRSPRVDHQKDADLHEDTAQRPTTTSTNQ